MSDENSESQDQSQKTEEATHHKIEQAREKGQIPLSREINHWMVMLAILLGVALFVPYSMINLISILKPLLMNDGTMIEEARDVSVILNDVVTKSFLSVALPFLALMCAGVAAGLAQTQFLISAESIKPKLSKISILAGIKRIFSGTALNEFIKGLFKFTIISSVLFVILLPEFRNINYWAMVPVQNILDITQAILIKILITVISIMGVVAGVDYFYQYYNHRHKLKMSKQDIKDEYKSTEGDPLIKRRLAELRRQRANAQRISTSVPEASVVITNPTHYAVALKYEQGETDAPICVAKGMDFIALRIRELAEKHDVPIIEDPPLARALYATADIDQIIPEKYYFAVARVVRFIMGMDAQYRATQIDE